MLVLLTVVPKQLLAKIAWRRTPYTWFPRICQPALLSMLIALLPEPAIQLSSRFQSVQLFDSGLLNSRERLLISSKLFCKVT
jgi:hypothetical protein